MKDFEKAIEISKTPAVYETEFDLEKTIELQRYNAAMLMAQWKQEQMIEWLDNDASSYMSIYWEPGGYATPEFDTERMIEDFKKAMEENL